MDALEEIRRVSKLLRELPEIVVAINPKHAKAFRNLGYLPGVRINSTSVVPEDKVYIVKDYNVES